MSAGKQRRQTRSTHRPFRATRRDPTDYRSWRHTPAWVGDIVAHVEDAYHTMIVTGVLPRGRLEVVPVERLRAAVVGRVDGLDDVQEALADGRVFARAVPRREVSPLTEGMADVVLDKPGADADTDTAGAA